jgi:hypothetical protein
MSNLSYYDTPRWEKHMKMLDKIKDPARPCGDYRTWRFFVKSKSSNVVFECISRKKVLSKEELYQVVEASLPDGYEIGTLLGATAGYSGHRFIDKETDLQFVFDFTCY